MTDTTIPVNLDGLFGGGPQPCPTCGASFPTPANRGVITCANGHGWTVTLAGSSDTGVTWEITSPDTDEHDALNRAAADLAHRDDLARDVAREWTEKRRHPTAEWEPVGEDFAAALDRLAAAYGTGEQQT